MTMPRRPGLYSVLLGAVGATVLLPSLVWAAPTQPGQLVNPLFGPTNCEFCHLYPNPIAQSDDPDYAPLATWQGSMMANSARDPVFWAGVAVADQDSPGDTELCIRCHSPRAFLDGNGDATSIDELSFAEQQGVECMLCHRMMEDPEVEPGNAMYTLDDVVVGTNVPRRGPWDFSDGVPEPPHSYINDPYTGTSRLCGTCHDVTTERERVDDDGVGLGVSFNEQRTYSEWLGSAYAIPGEDFASCQDCHMPAVVDMAGCTAHANNFSHAEGGRRHDLVGANRFMIEVLQAQYGSAGQNTIGDEFFETAIERVDAFLPTSATLEVEGPEEVDLVDGLSGLAVTVTNNTGHKLPTGYSEGRVMWVEVIAEYAGQTVVSSGAWDAERGLIQRDPQLRTYEGIGEDYADGTRFHLLLNNHWVVDSRIPPRGLLPNIETDPVGDRYTLLPDGTWPNFDEHTYDFGPSADIVDATPDDTEDDELLVTVRLRYVINTTEYIDFLGDEGMQAGQDIATTFDLAGGAPAMILNEQTLSIPIVGFGAVAGTTTTDGGSTAGPTSTSTSTTAATSTDATGVVDGTGPGADSTTGLIGGTAGPTSTTAADTDTDTAPSADDGGGGCNCSTSNAGGPDLGWLGAFGLLALVRRRRRSAAN